MFPNGQWHAVPVPLTAPACDIARQLRNRGLQAVPRAR